MASQVNYDELADGIIERLGGANNIGYHTHCVTRLRFTVKDRALVKKDEIASLKGVIDALWSGEQFQVIIGNTVNEAYDAVVAKLGAAAPAEEPVSSGKKRFSFDALLDVITGVFSPAIPAVAGCGLMKAMLSLLTASGVLSAESQMFYILSFVADSAFYFLPMILAYSAAAKFKCNPAVSLAIAGIMLHPKYAALVTAGDPVSFLGLPITLASYATSVIPILLVIWAYSYVERLVTKIVPKPMRMLFVPLLSLLIMAPLALCVLGPAGTLVGNALAAGIMSIEGVAPWFIPTFFGFVSPLLVMTGMHGCFYPARLAQLTSVGYQTLSIGMLPSNNAQGAASIAVALKTKDPELRELAISAGITAFCGITEPALYGITLRLKKPLIAVMIGGGLGGLYYGLTKIRCFIPGGTALTGFAGYIDGANPMNVVHMFIGVAIAVIVTFVLTLVLYKDKQPAKN